MSYIETKEGVKIYYKDWGYGQPILFSHGWPLCSDAWDAQMLFFLEKGYRVIAHDRRGHGRSSQTFENNTMDQYADDLSAVMEHLDLQDVILVGHSTGGGEVTRYCGRHGTSRVAKLVLLNAVPPLMLKTEANPDGIPMDVFDDIRKHTAENRAQYFKDFPDAFYGFNRLTVKRIEGLMDSFWLMGMTGGIKSIYDSIKQFSETDFTEDLKRIDIPTWVCHGEDDQIVPIKISAEKTAQLIKGAKLTTFPKASHGFAQVNPELFNEGLLNFIEEGATKKEYARPTRRPSPEGRPTH